jgi:DNA replication protein DnaC
MAESYCTWSGDEPLRSMVLLSPDIYGVGKTHLAAALVNYIIDTIEPAYFRHGTYNIIKRRQPVFFTSETTLLDRIRATFNSFRDQETEADVFKKMIECHDVLVIDDVGKYRPRDYNFLQSVYFRIIDGRYMGEVPVLLTTNLNFHELENHIGGACADRLREMCGDNFIVMKGQSYRHA